MRRGGDTAERKTRITFSSHLCPKLMLMSHCTGSYSYNRMKSDSGSRKFILGLNFLGSRAQKGRGKGGYMLLFAILNYVRATQEFMTAAFFFVFSVYLCSLRDVMCYDRLGDVFVNMQRDTLAYNT